MKIHQVLLVAALCLGVNASSSMVERLVKGENAEIGEFPYQASLRRNHDQHHCGGALVSTRHVLTAAHCITSTRQPNFGRLTVVLGTNSLTSGGQSYDVARADTHPDYVDKQLADWMYDVGVITLSSEVKLTKLIGIVNLPVNDVEANTKAVVTGWGSMKGPATPIPDALQKLSVDIIGYDECVKKMPWFARVHSSHVCTFVGKGSGVCNRDSGGPLVQNGAVVGVVSGGIPCARGHPDIFTNVFTYLPYIRKAMKQV